MFIISKTKKAVGLLSLIILFTPVSAVAASFSHTHSNSCYQTENDLCTTHHIRVYTQVETKHCFNCLVMQPHTVKAYYDQCDAGLIAEVTLGYSEKCNACGSYRKNEPIALRPPHSYEKKTLICSFPEGAGIADVNLAASETAWTNSNVILSVKVSNMAAGFSLAASPYDFGMGFGNGNSYEVSANGTYTVSVKALDGNTVSATYTVSNIDKTAPVLSVSKSTEDWTESGVTLYVTASDSDSGLSADCYSYDGGAYTSNREIKITANRIVTVSVKDNAGNVRTESINVTNIGRNPQIVAAEKAEREAREKEERERKEREAREQEEREKEEKEKAQVQASNGGTPGKKPIENTSAKESEENVGYDDTLDATESQKDKEDGKSEETSKDETGLVITKSEAGAVSGIVEVIDVAGVSESTADNSKADSLKEKETAAVTMEKNEFTQQPETGSPGQKVIDNFALIAGIIVLVMGLLMVLSLNYICIIKNGRMKLITTVKVERFEKRIIVYVPERKLENGGKYSIVFSPVNRILSKNKTVYAMLEEKETLINTDEGVRFTY